ncbi:unnamed protein product [Triticum aestivum]|uniref:CCHC-type domain-containing protein n=1 Tax=Triticum aestivum TaxID=4565 RepID=A0A7H4LCF9_WHEAT|nr:unnamed protein product [Triticum aestivum]
MASSKGNYHHRGPYFDGTNFASCKHKMKMHILGHNPAVWAIVCIGLQGEFFDGREPNREATAEELKMLQYNAQACDILFNGLCPEEFNKISRLVNAKEIWDTLIDMDEGTDSVKESKLDVLQSQLNKFKMKDGEGVAEMYSRLALITNEIAGLGSEEMTDRFIIKKILTAWDGKYDTVCTLIQMIPNYKDLKPTEVIGRIVAHEMSLKDKEELHNKSSGAYKASCDASTSSSEKQTFNEELSLMVKNFNKFYKSRSKERSSKSRSYKRSSSHERNCYNCGRPGHCSNECTAPYKRREDSPKRRSRREESPPRERRSRDDHYERRSSRRSKDSERKDKSSKSYTKRRHQAHVGEWVSGSDSDHHSERSYHSDSEYTQDEGIGRCFMAKGPKVSHPEYVDFNSDEDDLLGDDDLLVDNSSYENHDELAINHADKDKTNDDDKKEIERLTKELNTLKLAHETSLEDHRELLKTHEKLRFEKLNNLEQEHEFLKAINDDLRKKSSSYIAKHLLLSTYMPQVKSSNKSKKDCSSSSNNNHAKSNVLASSSSLDSTNDSLSQVTLEQENSLLKGIIEKGVYKSLAGSKQFEEIVRKQGRHRKNQGVGFERKFNANEVEWEEDQYPKTKFVPQQEKYDPTSFQGTQAQDNLPPQDHKQKRQGQASRGD